MKEAMAITNMSTTVDSLLGKLRTKLEALSDPELCRVVENYNRWFNPSGDNPHIVIPVFQPRPAIVNTIISTRPLLMPGGLIDFAEKYV